jgi:hypothetical protein
MNNFSIGGIVSLTPATHALLTELTDIVSLPIVMSAKTLAVTIERCRDTECKLGALERELLGELLADLEPLADCSAPALPAPTPGVLTRSGQHRDV